MKKSHVFGLIAVVAAGSISTGALADPEPRRYCSDSLVRGTYAIQLQGTRPAPAGATESVIGVVVRNYDGEGGVMQVDNVKGSITGIVPNRVGVGTYRVNDDCTVDVQFQPGPGILLQEKAVIVDEGKELLSITVLPAGVMVTSRQRRI